MNRKILWAACAFALTGVALPGVAAERVELKTDMEKNGYSVGYDIGRSLKRQLPDVDAASTAQGLKDAIGGDCGIFSSGHGFVLCRCLSQGVYYQGFGEFLSGGAWAESGESFFCD